MLPSEFEEDFKQVRFWQPDSAQARLLDLASDPAEELALARIAPELGYSLESCPDPDRALKDLDRFAHAHGSRLQLYHLFADHPAILDTLIPVLSSSQYLADVLIRNPEYLDLLGNRVLLGEPRLIESLRDEIEVACASFGSREGKLDAVRRFRRHETLRIGAADLRGMVDFKQTTSQISHLADASVEGCLGIESGESDGCSLIVLALGKLGGNELNYSSDIDLLFVAEGANVLQEATRLAQSVIYNLEEFSAEGFLYRVDLRLRPYGSAGALVVSTEMLEEYLATKAPPAQRQAMLKARAIAGDVDKGNSFLEKIAPLLWEETAVARRNVRELKDRIERQLNSRGQGEGNIKLEPGGIRDVEFIAQALQLENGQYHPELRTGNTLEALARLTKAGLLDPEDELVLREAYVFLRVVEHRLQLMDNRQVHNLPKVERELRVLARIMGFRGSYEAEEFRQTYEDWLSKVRSIFDRIL